MNERYMLKASFFLVIGITILGVFGVFKETQAATDWTQCRVESGETAIANSDTSKDITLDTSISNLSKAFLLVNESGASAVLNADDGQVSGYIYDVDTLRFERVGNSGSAKVSYHLVECKNDEFSVQRGEIAIASSSTSNTDTITSVTTGKSIVLVSARNSDTSASRDSGMVTGELTDSTTVSVERGGDTSSIATVRYEVVEFDSSVNVYSNEVTLGSGDASTTDTITSVDLNNTWLLCSFDANTDGLRQTSVACDLTNATTVKFERYASGTYTNRI